MSISTQQLYPSARAGTIAMSDVSTKKFLVVIQYWDGDRDRARDMAHLIADLERTRNTQADVLIFGRFDALSFDSTALNRLRSKFARVHEVRCGRRSAGYPGGANEMFFELANIIATQVAFKDYFAFVNLESDCAPTSPGWISALVDEFNAAKAEGKMLVGHLNPVSGLQKEIPSHFNGVAVYDSSISRKLGAVMTGCKWSLAYDIALAPHLIPHGKDTPLIYLDYNRPSITPESLYTPRKGGKVPVLFHGVKDGTALSAVRAKHITPDQPQAGQADNMADRTVFTYFDVVPQIDANEQKVQLALWKKSWTARGWNPVVLRNFDAQKHPLYTQFLEHVKGLPTTNPRAYEVACFVRWLALDAIGGGLMTDYDVVNNRLRPSDIAAFRGRDELHVLQAVDRSLCPAVSYASAGAARKFIEFILAQKDRTETHMSDQTLINEYPEAITDHAFTKEFGEEGWEGGATIHFANSAVAKHKPGFNKSGAMTEFMGRAGIV